jgi:hypothetical protein
VSHGSSMTSSAAATLAGSQAPASAAPTDAPSHPRIPIQSRAFAYMDTLRQASNMENGSTSSLSAKRPVPLTVSNQPPPPVTTLGSIFAPSVERLRKPSRAFAALAAIDASKKPVTMAKGVAS